jgi:hypothetical protein
MPCGSVWWCGTGGAGTEAVVLVDADPDATVAALLPALLGAVGSAIHPGFASKVPVWVDGRPVQPEDTARESGLAAGSVVCLHENDATPSTLPTGIVEVRVVLGAGRGADPSGSPRGDGHRVRGRTGCPCPIRCCRPTR